MKKVLTVVGLSLALVGCSGLEVDDKPMKEAEKTVEKVADKPAYSDKDKEVVAYANQLRPLINSLVKNGNDLKKVARMGNEDPEIVYTEKYLDTVYLICEEMQRNVDAIRAIGAQTDKDLGAVHKLALKGADELEDVAQDFPDAIASHETEIDWFIGAFVEAGNYFDEATQKLDELSDEQ
jgi:hypothetical protein